MAGSDNWKFTRLRGCVEKVGGEDVWGRIFGLHIYPRLTKDTVWRR